MLRFWSGIICILLHRPKKLTLEGFRIETKLDIMDPLEVFFSFYTVSLNNDFSFESFIQVLITKMENSQK